MTQLTTPPRTIPEVHVYHDRHGQQHAVFLQEVARHWFEQGMTAGMCEVGRRVTFDRLQAGDTPQEAWEAAMRAVADGSL